MKITKVKIKKVAPNKGLVGFCSCVLDDCLYIGNIAIYTRLNQEGKIRLVFPIKKVDNNEIPIIYPLTSELYYLIEKIVQEKAKEVNLICN